jgi:flagellar basal-body rod protein FlgB
MFDLLSTNGMIQTMDRSMTLATRRTEFIASNLANIDTPGYRTQDFDFEKALKSELAKLDGAQIPLARTDPKHLPATSTTSLPPVSDPMSPAYERNDGNDVSLDRESMLLARTQVNYQLASNFAQTELRKITQFLRSGAQ